MRHIIFSFLALAIASLLLTLAHPALAEKATPAAATAEEIAQSTQGDDTANTDAATTNAADTQPDEQPLYKTQKLDTIGMAKPWQLGFQQGVTASKHAINDLHYWVTVGMTIIVIFVTLLLAYVCIRFRKNANPVPSKVTHNTTIEVIWTVIPILILVAIAIPSLRAHYGVINNFDNTEMTLKVVGHQWYWSYEYPKEGIAFDSNIKKVEELLPGEPRLLAVDNPVYVPVNTKIRVQMTAADVIHDWAVPSFGIKKDVVPGRLNEVWFKAEKEGIYYGQCSELCGKFHGFMPIEVRVVSKDAYASWVKEAKVKFASSDVGTTAVALNP